MHPVARMVSCALAAAAAAGCSSSYAPSTAHVATAASDAQVRKRVKLLDAGLAPGAACDDFQLALGLIHFIQGAPVVAENIICPTSYAELAPSLRRLVASLGDIHARVELGYGLDTVSDPIVTACSDDALGPDFVGATVLGVQASVDDRLYAAVATPARPPVIVEILAVDGRGRADLAAEALATANISHTPGGLVDLLAPWLLRRQAFDGRSRAPSRLQVRALASGRPFELVVSVDPDQIFATAGAQSAASALAIDHDYGCGAQAQICRISAKTAAIWLPSWDEGDSAAALPAPVLALNGADQLEHVILDLRQNTGGSSSTVVRTLCAIGDDSVVATMERRQVVASLWPETIALADGQVVGVAALARENNLDLVRFAPAWHATDASEPPRRWRQSLLARAGLTPTACRALRLVIPPHVRWHILLSGAEMSATETFASVVKGSPRFQLIGRATRGGTGSPVRITLPHTRAVLRLSQARQIEAPGGAAVIEGIGVEPDLASRVDLAEDFERRALNFAAPSLIIRQALGEAHEN